MPNANWTDATANWTDPDVAWDGTTPLAEPPEPPPVAAEVSAPGGRGVHWPTEIRRKILRDDEEVLVLT